jgi:hypothetical protein
LLKTCRILQMRRHNRLLIQILSVYRSGPVTSTFLWA